MSKPYIPSFNCYQIEYNLGKISNKHLSLKSIRKNLDQTPQKSHVTSAPMENTKSCQICSYIVEERTEISNC